MKVVSITTNVTALNRPRSKTPLANPIRAKISPTLPRGIIPTPMTFLLPRNQNGAYPAANFPTTAATTNRPATNNVLGEAGMSATLPDERYRDVFPTIGHAVVHILTGHAAVHVGQVSVWRRAAGYQPLSEWSVGVIDFYASL